MVRPDSSLDSGDLAISTQPGKHFHIFGSGIAFSISPTIHNGGFKYHRLPHIYDIRESSQFDQVAHLIQSDKFGGASVTMPHKLVAHNYCDRQTETAKLIGAVNTLIVQRDKSGRREIVGENTDWSGLLNIIEEWRKRSQLPDGIPRAGLVIGAGGASRAAVYALHRAGVRRIFLANRTREKAEQVCNAFRNIIDNLSVIPGLEAIPELPDIIIGTIPAQETTEDQFMSLFRGSPGLCIDMCYKPFQTPLLNAAQRHPGWNAVMGVQVLLAQAFDQYRLWIGVEPPKQAMIDAVRARETSLKPLAYL